MTLPAHLRDPALILKATPPRVARALLQRDRLSLERLDVAGTQVLAALAPTGFGKTSQLSQWRRESLARGALALWLTLDAKDEPLRLVSGLAHAAQQAVGRRGFDASFTEWLERCADAREAVTGWLAEVARLSVDVLLVLDEVDRAPSHTREQVISYLLGNAPANLRIALGARPAGALMASGDLSRTPHIRVLASDLRFRPDETLAVLSEALGSQFDVEAGMRLHELTEGWPLGVQLAVAAIRRNDGLSGLLAAATADIRRYFIDAVIDQQPADTYQLLVRMALLDPIHPDLCAAATNNHAARSALQHLSEHTPLLLQAEGSEWMRLHPLAREVLDERVHQLPLEEQQLIARRSSAWLAAHGMPEAAAEQALRANDAQLAYELAERSIRRMMMQGRIGAILEWHARLPAADLAQHPGFLVPIAWALAMSERHAQALPLIAAIQQHPQLPASDKFEADLIALTVSAFSDRIDHEVGRLAELPAPPSAARPDNLPIFWVVKGFAHLHEGQPDQARICWGRIANLDRAQAYSPMSYGFSDYGLGLSYLWEGRCHLAEQTLRPALVRAEERMNRRNLVACMLATLLAEARWEAGDAEEPGALLALRLDVLERQALPDALLSAYLTLARMAEHDGRQDKALSLLEALRAIGHERDMPRLRFAAQCEMVRQHARQGRADMARVLSRELTLTHDALRPGTPAILQTWLALHTELARAHAALANPDNERLPEALQALGAASSLASSQKMGREWVEVQFLRAQALRRRGEPDADTVQDETMSLARSSGLVRLMQRYGQQPRSLAAPDLPRPSASADTHAAPDYQVGGALLTAKEREVLSLLTGNLSNKEIALAMGVSEQTIKWHVKNLFTKLGGLNRKHAVARARTLGLLPP